jgi:hypothetical protein
MHKIVAVLLLSGALAAPTTFPFENEAYVPPQLVASTPSYTFTDDDDGGYHWTHIWNLDLNTVDMPFCIMISDCNAFTLVYTFNAPPVLPIESWNCSSYSPFFTQEDFTGVVNGASVQTVCQVGNCCKDFMSEYKFADDQPDWHNWLDNLSSSGLCEDVPVEILYCNLVNGHYQGNCFNRLLTQLTRTLTLPCVDVHTLYFLSCPVYKTVAIDFGFDPEPKKYLDGLTNEERIVTFNSEEESDHVCHPYSYFFPAAGSPAGSASAADDESSAALASLVFLFAFI